MAPVAWPRPPPRPARSRRRADGFQRRRRARSRLVAETTKISTSDASSRLKLPNTERPKTEKKKMSISTS